MILVSGKNAQQLRDTFTYIMYKDTCCLDLLLPEESCREDNHDLHIRITNKQHSKITFTNDVSKLYCSAVLQEIGYRIPRASKECLSPKEMTSA